MSGFLDALASAPGSRSTISWAGGRWSSCPRIPTTGRWDAVPCCRVRQAKGVPCHVVCVTDGSRSHPNSIRWPAPGRA